MKWEMDRSIDHQSVEESWSAIACNYYNDHPLLDFRFISAALNCFSDPTLRFVIGRMGNETEVVGLIVKKSIGNWETFCPSQLPMTLLLQRPGFSTEHIVRSLFDVLPGFPFQFAIRHYDNRYYPEIPSISTMESVEYFLTMDVDCSGSFQEFWQSRSKNLRKSIRRYERRVDNVFTTCRFEVVVDSRQIFGALRSYAHIECRGWKGTAGSAIEIGTAQGQFYQNVLRELGADQRVRIFQLFFGDTLVSSRLAVVKNKIMVILKTTYDEEFSRYSPGRLLLKRVLEYAFEQDDIMIVEFYTKASPDQLQWATGSRMIFHYNVYRNSTTRTCFGLARNLRRIAVAAKSRN